MKVEAINVPYIGDNETDVPCCSIFPFTFSFNDSHEDLKKSLKI